MVGSKSFQYNNVLLILNVQSSIMLHSILCCLKWQGIILQFKGSSVASERAFSSASHTDTLNRNRMRADLFGEVQLLKSAYKAKLVLLRRKQAFGNQENGFYLINVTYY